jgi:cobalt-precorrin-5B (C1)-methyltransferase
MIDPVNNFQIPEEWVKRARISIKELETCISNGLFVLLSDGSLLRRGYTTGTTADAAVKASVLSLKKEVSEVSIPTPAGIRTILLVFVKNGKASATRDPGDQASDVTGGIKIITEAREHDSIVIKAGMGIGSKEGIPAINPVPVWCWWIDRL